MRKQIISLGLLIATISVNAQMMYKQESDTIRILDIEDVNLHRTGNPNKARVSTNKSTISVMETPQPIAIVTHEIIEQQQSKQLSDVIKNVNGLYLTSSRGGSQDSFGGRGFTFGNENIFKNGGRINSGIFPEVSSLERVEVLKGANAMLYGNVAPGGIVNLITKKPRFEFGGSLGLNIGSWNSYKPTVDIYGPLSKNIAFRMNGTYEYAESFRDVVNSKKHYFNPSFVFNVSDKTQIIVEGDYLSQEFTPDFGLGSIVDTKTGTSTLETNLDKSTFLGEDWNFQKNQMATSDIIVNHQFNDKWMLNSVATYQNYTKDYFSVERIQWNYDSSFAGSTPTWKRVLNRTYNEQNYTSLQLNLNGEFQTGKLNHKILVGTDGDYGLADTYTYYNPANGKTYGTSYSVGNWVLNNPETWTTIAEPEAERKQRTRITTRRFGVYAQDFLEVTNWVKVMAGVRYSYLENDNSEVKDFTTNTKTETANSRRKNSAFSPKFGLVITPNESLTIYGTYTNSFVPNSGFDINNKALEPSTANQYELGLKKNVLNNAVSFNLSLYQINQDNTYTAPYLDTGATATYRVYAGEIQSRGIELDITGNPTSQLSLIGGISYNHSVYKNTPEDGFVEDQRLTRTPAFTANASAFYKFKNDLKGFTIGASAFYTGDRKAGWNDVKNQPQVTRMIDVDGFTTVDLSLGYEYKKFLLQGKVGNLLDAENYSIHENYSVNPITPRNFYFTLTYKL